VNAGIQGGVQEAESPGKRFTFLGHSKSHQASAPSYNSGRTTLDVQR